MSPSDAIGSAVMISFGLWWVLFPASVIRFYTWFHRGGVALPRSGGVRIAGALWLAVVASVLWSTIFR